VTTERIYLTVAEVVAIHRHQIEEYGGEHGLLNQGSLESAVFRPQTGYYDDLSEEAAALLESLVNNHPFLEGNDRVGFAAVHTFLLVNGFDLNVTSDAALEFMRKKMAEGASPASRMDLEASCVCCDVVHSRLSS
jgi:death-on-curing protein